MNINILKRLCAVLLAGAMMLSFFACGPEEETTESGSDGITTEAPDNQTTETGETDETESQSSETESQSSETESQSSETESQSSETESESKSVCQHGDYDAVYEGGEYRYTCSSCQELLYAQKVAENVEVFVSPIALAEKYDGNTTDIGGFKLTVNSDECYIRVRGGGSHGTYNFMNVYENDGSAVSGQYMLIKYRIGKNGLRQDALQMFVSTEIGEIVSSKQYVEFSVSEDNEWHVALIDLSKLTGNVNGSDYLPDEDGKYRAQFIQIRPVTHNSSDGSRSDYMDIAYIALFDDVADIKGVVVEENYENHTARDSFCVVQTATNSCIECSFAEVERNGVYSFECPGCGRVYSQLDATGIKAFFGPSQIAKPAGNVFLTNKGVQKDDDGTVYTRIYGGGNAAGAQLQIISNGSPKVDPGHARYAVIKVRGNLRNVFIISTVTLSGTKKTVEWPSNKVSEDTWLTAVIDLWACAPEVMEQNPDGSYTLDRLSIVFASGFTTSSYYDFAYIALCRDWSEVEQIVDQDTVEFRDASGYKTISHDADPNNDADRVETETVPGEEESEDTEVETSIIYDRYDLDSYMEPVWNGNIVRNETVMFVGINDKMQLLYDADEIISVRSYDLKTEYVRGVDYDYVDGYLVLLEGTRIPYITEEQYYTAPEKDYLYTMYQGKETATLWGEGDTMVKWQLAVTYKPSSKWSGYEVPCNSDKYADFIKKLENGEDVTVFFYGDSITTGANSSGVINVEPYAPSWTLMFTQYMAKKYGYTVTYVNTGLDRTPMVPSSDTVYGDRGTITYVNTAVGGWTTQQGLENVEKHVNDIVKDYGCDLFVLAYGMNNGGTAPSELVNLLETIVDRVKVYAPEMDVVLVATMVPNPEAVRNWYGNQEKFEAPMITRADKLNNNGTSCAVAPVTSMSLSLLKRKRFRDYTGNNINHPNDFMARVYAQVMVETVFGYENLPE